MMLVIGWYALYECHYIGGSSTGNVIQSLRRVVCKLDIEALQLVFHTNGLSRWPEGTLPTLVQLILPHQVWQSDHWSDLHNRCALQLYEREGCEQHDNSLWRHRFTDCSVEVTLTSDRLVISRCLPVADKWTGEDESSYAASWTGL